MRRGKYRDQMVSWVRNQLIGPVCEDQDVVLRGIKPLERHPCGVLFPVIKGGDGLDVADGDADEDIDDDATSDLEGRTAERPIRRKRYIPPSSMGFSFFVMGKEARLVLATSAAVYQRTGDRDSSGRFMREEWLRVPLLCSDLKQDSLLISSPGEPDARQHPTNRRISLFAGRAGVDVLWRPFSGGWIVTVSLFNDAEIEENLTEIEVSEMRNSHSIFEASLRCLIENGEVGEYPRVDFSLLSPEERELELQYRSKRIYAVGHGASVQWETTDGRVREIRTEFLPTVEVPQVTADVSGQDHEVLDLDFLSSCGTSTAKQAEIIGRLRSFVGEYGVWVDERRKEAPHLSDVETAERIVARMHVTLARMREGVALLESDSLVARAFALANRAMADQMRQDSLIKGGGARHCQWRPFQLAFLLTTIGSIVNEDCEYRDTVDLIWFPTGGGKTEAYLGLIAFLIGWRRMKFPQTGGGTTALMRYTLRLLTGQQFERATRLICAMELIRLREPESGLGNERITLGMWVGGAASPNSFKKAAECVEDAISARREAPVLLVLRKCPWCGNPFDPANSYRASQRAFAFRCCNSACDFSGYLDGILPCNVVDEALYKNPPTLLIATIDKFARLAWEDRAGAFFGNDETRPPELVIQDELHLIAGALGSVAGLYEAALDTVLISKGIHPKIVASTATIRMAAEQVRRLYGREVSIFPPPGLECNDSFFARTVPLNVKPGRLYVGFLAPALDRRHCMAPLAAALIAAPAVLFTRRLEDRERLLDAWWTLVVYHGSIKGVGISWNAFGSDVQNRLRRMLEEVLEQPSKEDNEDVNNAWRERPAVAELQSQTGPEKNAEIFARLERPKGSRDCLDAVLATNMISVGLDVSRLALMVVNGQPLTTGEYIQSTSRVGRGETPGLVFVNFYRDQARSLSHYEHFRGYHESFYRYVEPTSITPFTHQARDRALHAALVIVARHSVKGLCLNKAAGLFSASDERLSKVLEILKSRLAKAAGERAVDVCAHLDRLVDQWDRESRSARESKCELRYHERKSENQGVRLLRDFNDPPSRGLWPTLQSMRNVEDVSLLKQT